MTETRTFMGMKIEGDINSTSTPNIPQRPKEELGPLLQPLLEHPSVEAIRWRQYTPYFNDGDPCTFGVGEISVRITGTDEDAGDGEDGFVSTYDDEVRALKGYTKGWGKDEREIPGSDPVFGTAFKQAEKALEGGEFENALLELFGDHAEVTVYKDRIVVDSYDHD
jgi:hypothetical protein